MKRTVKRLLLPPKTTFFLFGPRSVGKSFWLKQHFARAPYFDLLDGRTVLEFSRDSSLLEAKIGTLPRRAWVCIDEIQRVPALLSEVHRLIADRGWRFALSGSSARKLRRGNADMLAGRAVTSRMEGFTAAELGISFDLDFSLKWGGLPIVVGAGKAAADILSAYVHTYIKEEIKEEGLVRRAEPFLRFLEVAGTVNGQIVNKENIARDARVPRSTVDVYFSIMEDTLLGHFLPAYRPNIKVREQSHPKFYWFDTGVARGAAGLLYESPHAMWLGWSLETMLFHELRVHNHVHAKHRPISYYRTEGGAEIDFVIETRKQTPSNKAHMVCIEVKYAKRWDRKWERAMRSLAESKKVVVEKMIGVYCGRDTYHFNGVDVMPIMTFLNLLYKGLIF